MQKKNLSYITSRWSDFLFNKRYGNNKLLKTSVLKLETALNNYVNPTATTHEDGRHFAREIFARMYEKPKQCISPEAWAMQAHEIATQSKDFNTLAKLVNDDPDFSAMATSEIIEKIAPYVAELFKKNKDNKAKKSKRDKKEMEALCRNIRRSISKANSNLSKDINQIKQAMNVFSHGGKSGIGNNKSENRSGLINILKNNRKVRQIIDKAGRLLNVIDSLPSIDKCAEGNIDNITIGNNLPKVLFKEYAYLSDTDTEDIFYKKYIDKELLQFDSYGHSNLSRGSVVVLIDESGSMGGAKDILAKSIAAAMGIIAMKNDRYFHAVTFDNQINGIYELHNGSGLIKNAWDQKSYDCEKWEGEECLPETAIACLAASFSGGGTNFSNPLRYAMNKCQDIRDADILFITDGYCSIEPEIIERIKKAKKNGLRIFTLLMNIDVKNVPLMVEISDKVIEVTQIIDSLESNENVANDLCGVISKSTNIV